ncbi:MAG: protein kinase, partial [Gemmataceae bacterium]|nr:protein kinase [Gemmataceae bacterium]
MLVGQTIGSGAYRFEIEAELGSGAMGMVYRARFYMDGKVIPVALKMVSLGLLGNEHALARFEREANILKQLRHPNIVRLYASGQYRKMPFIAMEFIDGESLDRILSRRG